MRMERYSVAGYLISTIVLLIGVSTKETLIIVFGAVFATQYLMLTLYLKIRTHQNIQFDIMRRELITRRQR